ncbi:GNAT family N-acetyltransferase [Gammaproteobacteria bacterium]|nr:GNAT family N-acetyltransferase [Gammaproteobacteria bacterium]
MRHDFHALGYGYKIRPVTLEDAEFIVELRTDRQRACYLNKIDKDVNKQRSWLSRYFDLIGDYYFAIECHTKNNVEGLVGIYNVNNVSAVGEWGRWILKPGSKAALGSALLSYSVAFESLGLEILHIHTLVENEKALAFHDRFGLRRVKIIKNYAVIDGSKRDAVRHVISATEWPEFKQKLAPTAWELATKCGLA